MEALLFMPWARRTGPPREPLVLAMGPLFAALVGMSLLAAPSAAAAGTASAEPWQAAPSAIVQAVTEVPQSVFDAVGLQPNIADPVILRGPVSYTHLDVYKRQLRAPSKATSE